jgi:hypothetical protein
MRLGLRSGNQKHRARGEVVVKKMGGGEEQIRLKVDRKHRTEFRLNSAYGAAIKVFNYIGRKPQ